MTMQPDPLALINGALSFGMQLAIESQEHPDPKRRRPIDFGVIDRALAAIEQLIAERGADALYRDGDSLECKRVALRDLAASAQPFRPNREARRA